MLYIGSDHQGYELKRQLLNFLQSIDKDIVDLGVFAIEEQADYPDIAREVAEKIAENGDNAGAMGILIDKTGIGMMMAANQVPGVRATVATNQAMAKMARECNNANVVCLGSEVIDLETAKVILDVFLHTEFQASSDEKRCVDKLTPKNA